MTRIADANIYREFSSEELKYKSEMLRRSVVKNLNLIEYDGLIIEEKDRVESFCLMIKNMLDANSITLKDLVKHSSFQEISANIRKNQLVLNQKILLK